MGMRMAGLREGVVTWGLKVLQGAFTEMPPGEGEMSGLGFRSDSAASFVRIGQGLLKDYSGMTQAHSRGFEVCFFGKGKPALFETGAFF